MAELVLLLVAVSCLFCNVCMVWAIFRTEKTDRQPTAVSEPVSEEKRAELEYQQKMLEGLNNIMGYTGAPVRKGRSE